MFDLSTTLTFQYKRALNGFDFDACFLVDLLNLKINLLKLEAAYNYVAEQKGSCCVYLML